MLRSVFPFKFLALIPFILLAGCFRLGPDYERPDMGIRVPSTYRHSSGQVQSPAIDLTWWKEFNDPQLNHLVSLALENNWDIKKAMESVSELAARVISVRADRFPALNVEGDAKRQKRPIIGIIPGKTFSTKTDSFMFSLPAFYEVDLWGRFSRAHEAALAQLAEAEEVKNTVVQGVIAETISLYFKINAIDKRLKIAEKRVENYREMLKVVTSRYDRGLTSILDVKQAKRDLSYAQSLIPSLRMELGGAQQSLCKLLGKYPDSDFLHTFTSNRHNGLKPVPPGLPSELLLRRPDVRAAESRLKALNALVGVAKANRFPRITLTGSFGYSSDELRGLFNSSNELWNIAMGLVQPLFDAGRLKAQQKAAEARYRQGIAEYAKTILRAFFEVENALLTRKEQLERLKRLEAFLKQAIESQKIAENRYSKGLVDYLRVLEARQVRYKAEEEIALVQLAILTNRVALYRALGGGWGLAKAR